ncbi:hypothetical protein H2203_002372 [Taxawa tesnikishii (nom. ined.)]|nr:hypothetical protein H2203_002372 [Dothideales sp. JES 119]
MAAQFENVSSDLIWEITRKQNSFLVKRKQAGGVQFDRDPLNLTNVNNRKYSGLANTRSIGINAGPNNTVVMTTQVEKNAHKPASRLHTTSFKSSTPSRKLYRSIVSSTAKKGYRSDLRAEAVARASAVKHSQRPVKGGDKAQKLRGAKARKAAAGHSAQN